MNDRLKHIGKKKTSGAFDDKVKSLEDKQNDLSISFNGTSKSIVERSQKLKDIEKQEENSKKINNLEKKYTNIEKTLKSYVDEKFVPKVDYMNNLNAILDIKAALEKLESQISLIKEELKIDYTTAIDTMQKKLIAKIEESTSENKTVDELSSSVEELRAKLEVQIRTLSLAVQNLQDEKACKFSSFGA